MSHTLAAIYIMQHAYEWLIKFENPVRVHSIYNILLFIYYSTHMAYVTY